MHYYKRAIGRKYQALSLIFRVSAALSFEPWCAHAERESLRALWRRARPIQASWESALQSIESSRGDVNFTALLQLAQNGDACAENQLFDLVEAELRNVAVGVARGSHLADATSLVNEAYVYLFERVKVCKNLDLINRRYFFTAIADRMRKILLDRAKRRRPGPWDPALDVVLEDLGSSSSWTYEALHESLDEFLQSDEPKQRRRHELINLHFFCGMTYKAAAAELGISQSQYQVDRDRALAELQQAISARTL
ncbi:MAG: ECF-type sigma factor [Planctomycetota bacterium]